MQINIAKLERWQRDALISIVNGKITEDKAKAIMTIIHDKYGKYKVEKRKPTPYELIDWQ